MLQNILDMSQHFFSHTEFGYFTPSPKSLDRLLIIDDSFNFLISTTWNKIVQHFGKYASLTFLTNKTDATLIGYQSNVNQWKSMMCRISSWPEAVTPWSICWLSGNSCHQTPPVNITNISFLHSFVWIYTKEIWRVNFVSMLRGAGRLISSQGSCFPPDCSVLR